MSRSSRSRAADRAEARARAQQLREEQARAERRRERLIRIGIAVAVLVVLVAVGIAVNASRSRVDDTAALPPGVTEPGGGLVIGDEDAPVTLDLWADFQCPACRDFEAVNAATIDQAVSDGTVRLVLHPLTFLDRSLDNSSSTPAANALACVAEVGDREALAFHDLVFANQPAEQSGVDAWTTDDLVRWAGEVGATGPDLERCVTDETYAGWVDNVGRAATSRGVSATPTLALDGEEVPADQLAAMFEDPAALQQAISETAAS